MKIITLDIETTGLVPKGATYQDDFMMFPRVLSIAWKVNEEPVVEHIINQDGFQVPQSATDINGITQKMVDDSVMSLFTAILIFIKQAKDADFIIGYNLYFDTSIIKANTLRLVQEGKLPKEIFDELTEVLHKDKRIEVMRACAKLFGGKWPTLSESYMRLFQESFNAHSAGSDVDATHKILMELIRLNAIKINLPEKVIAEVVEKVLAEEEY